jgi:hypothetical protein
MKRRLQMRSLTMSQSFSTALSSGLQAGRGRMRMFSGRSLGSFRLDGMWIAGGDLFQEETAAIQPQQVQQSGASPSLQAFKTSILPHFFQEHSSSAVASRLFPLPMPMAVSNAMLWKAPIIMKTQPG